MTRSLRFAPPALALALLVLMGPAAHAGDPAPPAEPPAWPLARAFVTAFNGGAVPLRRYFDAHVDAPDAAARDAHLAQLLALRARLGAVAIVEASGIGDALVVNVRTARAGDADVVLVVDGDNPRQLAVLRMIDQAETLALGAAP